MRVNIYRRNAFYFVFDCTISRNSNQKYALNAWRDDRKGVRGKVELNRRL